MYYNNPPEMSNWNAISTSLSCLLANTIICFDLISMGSVRLPQTRLVLMLIASINNNALSLQHSDCGICNQKQVKDYCLFERKQYSLYLQVHESYLKPSSIFSRQIVVEIVLSGIVGGILRRRQNGSVLYSLLAL